VARPLFSAGRYKRPHFRALILQAITLCAKKEVWPREASPFQTVPGQKNILFGAEIESPTASSRIFLHSVETLILIHMLAENGQAPEANSEGKSRLCQTRPMWP